MQASSRGGGILHWVQKPTRQPERRPSRAAAGTARWFESLGMKPGVLHAWLASLTEIVSGALLLLGFLTPWAGAGVVGTMVVAWITNHLKNGFFIFRPGEGYEYVMTLTLLGLGVAGLGAGEWSLDHAAGIFEEPSMTGF